MSLNHAANYRGILAIIGSSAFFSANDAAAKFAARLVPVSEVVAIRGFVALLIAIIVIIWRREILAISAIRNPFLLLRALIEAMIGILAIYTLTLMPLANFTAILLVQPFLIACVGAIWLGEKVGWRRWTAIGVGFVGMLMVMKPATEDFEAASLLALLTAFLAVARDLLVRKIGSHVPTTVISFSTALFSVPVGLLGAFVERWTIPDPAPLIAIIIAATLLYVAFLLTVMAFRGTDVSVVSPFRYSIVIFAVFFGLIVFGEMPDTVSILGIGVIVAAGLYVLHRETLRRKSAPAAAQ